MTKAKHAGGSRLDYHELTAKAIRDPGGAFADALQADDPTAVALVSIVDPSPDASIAVARLKAFAAHDGPTSATTEAVLGVLEQAEHLPEELRVEAESIVSPRKELPPVDPSQAERVRALTLDRTAPDSRRAWLLYWLWQKHGVSARHAAQIVLSDPDEPYSNVAHQALYVMGWQPDREARAVLKTYADRHLEVGTGQPDEPAREPKAALVVLNAIFKPTDDDLGLIAAVLTRAAQHQLTIGESLKRLLQRLSMQQIARVVHHLDEQGCANWLAQQFLPALIAARAGDIARSASADWWPEQCLPVFAGTQWEGYDDRLYPVVLQKLHSTDEEAACASIRERVAQRCQNTSSSARGDMPRIGARALLKLSLAGTIDTDEPNLLTALGELDEDSLAEEITNANWKKPERAARVGQIVAQVNPAVFPNVVSHALGLGCGAAAAVLHGGTAEILHPYLADLVGIVAGDETALAALCQISPDTAQLTLEWWQEDHDMIAFRALAPTAFAEDRLAVIPAAVRSYGKLTTAERDELLEAYGHRDERHEVLCGMLEDRHGPPGKRPSADDLIVALRLLGDHLAAGLAPDRALNHIGVVCTEARQAPVRQAAYAALGKGTPTSRVVDLLLKRQSEDTTSTGPAAGLALGEIASKLQERAADPAHPERAQAAGQLARIDPARAVVHARALLTADDAAERMIAAQIMRECGNAEDVDTLLKAIPGEPTAQVKSELQRAVRRLQVGDSAAAHERVGELAGLADVEAWVTLDPQKAYGNWVGPIQRGLNDVARAESKAESATAIDKLDEIAKALLFRVMQIAGDQVGVNKPDRAAATTNALDYGPVLARQQLHQKWPWVAYFASLHRLRTAHIAERVTVAVPPQRTADDLDTAYRLFKLGAHDCCKLLLVTVTRT